MSSPLRLGQLLLREGLVTTDQVEAALAEQSAGSTLPLGRLLVGLGAIDEATLAEFLARQFSLPLFELDDETPEPDALAAVPRVAALELQALPLRHDGDRLVVVVAEPPSAGFRRALVQTTQEPVRFAIAPADTLARALARWYPEPTSRTGANGHAASEAAPEPPTNTVEDEVSAPSRPPTVGPDDAGWMLSAAVELEATDVHMDCDEDGLWVRFWEHGAKRDELRLPARAGAALVDRLLRASGRDPAIEYPQAGTFYIEVDGVLRVARVISAQTRTGIKVVVRLEPTNDSPDFVALGLDPGAAAAVRNAARASHGLVVVAGRSESTRSTTIRALLAEADPLSRSVITVEDPPGSPLLHTAQLRLDEVTGLDAIGGLHTALAFDADVIGIDAPIDRELLHAAVHAALSGRLMVLGLAANDAQHAFARLTDAVDPFLVAAAATLIVAQLDDGEAQTLVVSGAVRQPAAWEDGWGEPCLDRSA